MRLAQPREQLLERMQIIRDGPVVPHFALPPGLGERHSVQPDLTGPDALAELDGIGARAQRYRTEIANGRWAIPPRGLITPIHPPHEDTPA